ncbi:3-alpha,7-alpha,12-alpha-trihydroxy-5-beta-cholest-24-enoyl-CoA hydratase [bacterium]|nr:3-alpha,7-alpha,12-alpha-trihydroxy-5-beta-cholest-24-enoyl-CoA hydratase [bacterium]
MTIDPSRALGASLPAREAAWGPDHLILYALGAGVGTGEDPTDPRVLQYTWEGELRALPTYAVIPVFETLLGLLDVPGMDFNPMMLLHGEQYTEILAPPLPVEARIVNEARISAIHDKGAGKGALIVTEVTSRDATTGTPLFRNEFTAFIRGEGGFARPGDPPAPAPGNEPPARAPDAVVTYPTLRQQALLYRLSGDRNPLHVDPAMAAIGGFERPILHGLCTFANVGRAAIDAGADGNPERFRSIKVRFAAPVYPGETIVVRLWRESATAMLCTAHVQERDLKAVITNARVTFFE